MAAQKQYTSPLAVGDTVRIVGDVCNGLVGELKTIDPEQEDECFFGVALDEIEGWIFFSADEIERVENVDLSELPDLGQEGCMRIIGKSHSSVEIEDDKRYRSTVFLQGDGKWKCLRCGRLRCAHALFVKQQNPTLPEMPPLSQEELSEMIDGE